MGVGCWYTNKYYDKNDQKQYIKAVWLEIDLEDEYDYQDSISNLFNDLKSILNVKREDKDCVIQTPLYNIEFEFTYNEDGIIIKQEVFYDNSDYLEPNEKRLQALAHSNFEKNYYSMINKLCKLGYKFRIATSSYTSGKYQP
jgi:hypothetical protein